MGAPRSRCDLGCMRSGYTVLELGVTLLLLGLALATAVPALGRHRDRMAVVAAREATAGLLSRARREALLSGGASLHVRRDGGLLWIRSERPLTDTLRVEERFGVTLEMTADEARLPFDALGIGRISSRTLTFARGETRAGLAVSAYGRVRRW